MAKYLPPMLSGQIPGLDANNIPINKKIARVCSGA